VTVRAAIAVARTAEAVGGVVGGFARVRLCLGCAGTGRPDTGCAGSAAQDAPDGSSEAGVPGAFGAPDTAGAVGTAGSAARFLVRFSGKMGAKTGSVSSVPADAVEAVETAEVVEEAVEAVGAGPVADTVEAGTAAAVVAETAALGTAVAACTDGSAWRPWARRRREMRLGVGSSKTGR